MPHHPQDAATYLAEARQRVLHGPEWPAAGTASRSGSRHDPAASLVSTNTPYPAEDRRLLVIGAGTMGRGIAQAGLAAGLEVVLADRHPAALERSRHEIQASLERAAAAGRLAPAEAGTRLARLTLAEDAAAAAAAAAAGSAGAGAGASTGVDLAIEAVYEDLDLKCRLLAELDGCLPAHALLVSNTSTLDIDAMARATRRPGLVLGMHFLTPAHVTPLVEVVRGAATSPAALARARRLALAMGKLPVLANNAWGFIGNRMYEGFLREVDALQLEGVPAHRIDAVLEDFGFALGPCRTLDLSGTDLVSQVIAARGRRVAQPPAYRRITRRLAELGRLGCKSGSGHYRYEGRRAVIDPELALICAEEARRLDIPQAPDISDAALLERCLVPLAEEGRHLLAEGVARRESDIDLVWVLGYGFPAARGGPMFHARGRAGAGRHPSAAE